MDNNKDNTTYYKDLVGKHVFITGGASGIGAQMVSDFAAQGAKVGFIDIDEECASVLCNQIKKDGYIEPWFRKVDVTNVKELQSSIDDATSELGSLYVLINNVANDTRHSPEELTEERSVYCRRKTKKLNVDRYVLFIIYSIYIQRVLTDFIDILVKSATSYSELNISSKSIF